MAGKMLGRLRLHYFNGAENSDKTYEIQLVEADPHVEVWAYWGRYTTPHANKQQKGSYGLISMAATVAAELARSKQGKGYRVVEVLGSAQLLGWWSEFRSPVEREMVVTLIPPTPPSPLFTAPTVETPPSGRKLRL